MHRARLVLLLAASVFVATPSARTPATTQAPPPAVARAVAPAGGILSNASDMARWLRVLLNRGPR